MSVSLLLRRAADHLDDRLNEAPGGANRMRHLRLLAAVWAAGTLLLLLFRPSYTFPPFELLDSWIYTSYQWDLRNQIADFGPTYYGSRLSWILPGAMIHSVLPPLAANLCYKLLVSALLAAACGAIVYRTRGLAAAMLAVGLSVVAPQIIVGLHADYIDTPVIVYAALTLACITLAKDSRFWSAWIFLAGMCFTGMAIANLSALAAPGLGIALFHLLWLRWSLRRQLLSTVIYLAAAGLVIVLVDVIHRQLGASFHFLKPQIDMLQYMNGLKENNPWSPKDWHWAAGATWLVVPVCALAIGLYQSLVAPSPDAPVRRLTQALTAGLAVSLGIAFILELRGLAILTLYYYSSYHLCLALPLLVLTCTSSFRPGRATALWQWATLIVLVALILAGDALSRSKLLFGLFPFLKSPEPIPLLIAGFLLAAGALRASWPVSADGAFLRRSELLLAGIVICSMPNGFHGHEISDHLRERYAAVHAAYRTIAREFPPGSFRYWVDGDHRDGISLASTKLWGFRLMTLKTFPDFDQPDLAGHTVIVPGAPGKGADILARARESLAARDLEPVSARILTVPGTAGAGFDLVCFAMKPLPFDPEKSSSTATRATIHVSHVSTGSDPYTQHLGFVAYGPRTGDLVTHETGYPVYHRTHHDDHLATQYVSLSPDDSGQARQFAAVIEMPAGGACTVIFQDDIYRELHEVLLTETGRSVHAFSVPADAKALRIVFASRKAPDTPLPTRVTVYSTDNR